MSSAGQMNRRVGVRERAPKRGSQSLAALKAAVSKAAHRTECRAAEPTERITVRAVLKGGSR